MNTVLYHFAAIVIIGAFLWTIFSLAYPGFAIDGSLALLFALAAIIIEGAIVFIWRRVASRGVGP